MHCPENYTGELHRIRENSRNSQKFIGIAKGDFVKP